MATIAQIVDELRHRGVTVHEWPGWNGRGNSDGGYGPPVPYIDVVGAVIHHTAINVATPPHALPAWDNPPSPCGSRK